MRRLLRPTAGPPRFVLAISVSVSVQGAVVLSDYTLFSRIVASSLSVVTMRPSMAEASQGKGRDDVVAEDKEDVEISMRTGQSSF
jgi:hypothetical protein